MTVIPYIRQGVLILTTLLSVVVLALAAHITSLTQQFFGVTIVYCALGIAVGVISLVTLPVMFTVDFVRRGAFTSMIVVELAWLFVLAVLWVASAGEAVTAYNFYFPFGCINYADSVSNGACQETQVIEAFSFLNFIILLLYAIALFVMAIVAATRGQGVWLSSVKESFGSSASSVQQNPMTQFNNTSAPPQPQYHTGTPVQPHYTGSSQPVSTPGHTVITV